MVILQSDWVRLFPGMLNAEPYQIVLYDNGDGWNTDKGWVDVAEAWNETRRHDREHIVHDSHGTDVDYYDYDGPIKPLAEAGLSQQAQFFADAEAAGRGLLEGQFPDVSASRLLYCANTTLVFQAEDKGLGQVAIKLTGMNNQRRSDMEAILPVLNKLGDKDHLVPLYRYEWLEAENDQAVLVQWMPCLHRAQPKVDPVTGLRPHIRKIGADITKALEALHSKGLVHLDVKLENLLFTKKNGVLTAYLGDFSSVKPVARQYEGKTSFTSDHAAPELRAGIPYSYGVDVYAWGQMMLRLLGSLTALGMNLSASGMNLSAYVTDKRGNVHIVAEADGTSVDRPFVMDAEMPLLPAIIRAVNRDPKLRHADGSALYADLEARLTFAPSIFKNSSAYKAYRSNLPSADPEFLDSFEKVIWRKTIGSGPYQETDNLSLFRYRDGTCVLFQERGGPMTGLCQCRSHFDDTISLEDYWKEMHYKYAEDCRISVERVWKNYIHCDYDSASGGFRSSMTENAQNNAYRNIDSNDLRIADWLTSCSNPYPPLIERIGEQGVSRLVAEIGKRRIRISLTEDFQNHRNCTAYLILNWLDGVLNVFSLRDEPATLTFFTPAEWQGELTELKRYLAVKNPWLKVEEFEEPASLLPKNKGQVAPATNPGRNSLPQSPSYKQTGNSGGQETRYFRFLVGRLLAILLLAALGNRDTSRNTSKETSPIAESTHGTYTLLAGDAVAQAVEVRLLEAKLCHVDQGVKRNIGLYVTVELTNLSESSIDSISGQATITAGKEVFTGRLLLDPMGVEPGQTKRVTGMLACDEDREELLFEDGTRLSNHVLEFVPDHMYD